MSLPTYHVLAEVEMERAAQDRKFGEQNWRDGTGELFFQAEANRCRKACDAAYGAWKMNNASTLMSWRHIMLEETFEALAEADEAALRKELIQVAAVAVAWVEAIDRRKG